MLYVLSTGGGKTVTLAFITDAVFRRFKRVYIEVHREELIDQTSATLASFGIPHGIVAPGHPLTNDLVQVCSVGTLVNRLNVLPPPDYIITDEGHHAIATTWRRITDHWPLAKVLLVTATPGRPDGQGLRPVADVMIIGPSMRYLINHGFLADYDYYAPPMKADIEGVRSRGGEYDTKELERRMNQAVITGDAVEHLREIAPTKQGLVFCVSVQHAKDVAAQFTDAGFKSMSVDGADPKRREKVEAFRRHEYQLLMSCQLIGEGFDVPEAAVMVDLAPTKSIVNYLQRRGRVLRPKADGSRAVILDHVNNVKRHNLPDTEREWTLDDKVKTKAEAISTCKSCYRVFFAKDRPSIACPNDTAPTCPYMKGEDDEALAARRKPLKKVAGKLEKVEPVMGSERIHPKWAPDIDLNADHTNSILQRASTKEHVMEIARAKGYNSFWVIKVLKGWRKSRRNVA